MEHSASPLTSLTTVTAACLAFSGAAATESREVVIQGGSPVPYLGYLSVYVAQSAGFFDEEGLNVTMNYAANAGMSVQLVAVGNGDISLNTYEPVIQGREKGIKTRIFARLNNSMLYYVAVPPGSGMTTAKALEGKKIGVSNLGSSALPIVKSMLSEAGVAFTDANFLPVGVGGQALAALTSGQVDALGLWDGIYFAMERGGAEFDYIKHPTLAEFGNLGLAMAEDVDAEQAERICAAGRAIAKATLFISENPEAVVPMYWESNPSARGTGDEAAAFDATLSEVTKMSATFGDGTGHDGRFATFDHASFQTFVKALQAQGYIAAVPDIGDVTTDAMLDCMNDFDADAVRDSARNWK